MGWREVWWGHVRGQGRFEGRGWSRAGRRILGLWGVVGGELEWWVAVGSGFGGQSTIGGESGVCALVGSWEGRCGYRWGELCRKGYRRGFGVVIMGYNRLWYVVVVLQGLE